MTMEINITRTQFGDLIYAVGTMRNKYEECYKSSLKKGDILEIDYFRERLSDYNEILKVLNAIK
jgi:hypothetical protein